MSVKYEYFFKKKVDANRTAKLHKTKYNRKSSIKKVTKKVKGKKYKGYRLRIFTAR